VSDREAELGAIERIRREKLRWVDVRLRIVLPVRKSTVRK
jgi:hypothetical protein